MRNMTRDDLRQAIFGSFDGLTSALGVIAGLLAAGVHNGGRILAGALGLAVAATIGMGACEYLSDISHNPRRALVMAAATLAGSIVPAIPFVTGYGRPQVIACGVLTICGALVIGRYRGYRITLGILAIVASLTVGLSVLVA
jgi:hypothetical protein